MPEFTDYIRQRLENNGYRCTIQSVRDIFISLNDKKIWICYLDAPIEPEQIRRCFDFSGHILFVVNEKLIPQEIKDRDSTPMWLRVIHGLYMGRIYVWNNRHLFGLHFDYDTGDVSESGIIQPDELLLIETGTWLRGWTGVYRLARFYDRAWWETQQSPPRHEYTYNHDGGKQQSNARTEYEQARDRYWEEQFKREWEQKRENQSQQKEYPPGRYIPENDDKRDFMREFAQACSPSAVKALFRKLAKEFHPDISGRDTTEEMAAINAAYERWK